MSARRRGYRLELLTVIILAEAAALPDPRVMKYM
jgi:hypothetical protein